MKLQTVLGKKLHMTSRFDARGARVGITVVSVKPNIVTNIRTQEKDGYMAIALGTGVKKHVNKPMQGHLTKANIQKAPQFMKETRVNEEFLHGVNLGESIAVGDVVKAGDLVSVQGVSKGKGFQGGMKRWGFHGGPATHGQSDRSRAPGSIGSGTTPGRVYKGKKMAGRMGTDTVTVKNVAVFTVNEKNNLIEIAGAVPGPRNGYIVINVIGENKQHVGPAKKEEPVELAESQAQQDLEATDDTLAEEKAEEMAQEKEDPQAVAAEEGARD